MPGGFEVVAHGAASGFGMADVVTVVGAGIGLVLYGLGAEPLLRSAAGRHSLPWWRPLAFGVGVTVAVVVLSSPAEHLADELFAAHMAQHLVLAFVVAPLLVLGRPVLVTAVLLGHEAAGVTRPLRRAAVRWRHSAALAGVLGAVHLVPWVLWHVPPAYDLALRTSSVHVVEHVTLVLSGVALTWSTLGGTSALRALATIGSGMAVMSMLAAVLVFAPVPLFTGHRAEAYGLTALEDQQLGGALMWFPGSLAYLVAAAALVLARLTRLPGARSPGARPLVASPRPTSQVAAADGEHVGELRSGRSRRLG